MENLPIFTNFFSPRQPKKSSWSGLQIWHWSDRCEGGHLLGQCPWHQIVSGNVTKNGIHAVDPLPNSTTHGKSSSCKSAMHESTFSKALNSPRTVLWSNHLCSWPQSEQDLPKLTEHSWQLMHTITPGHPPYSHSSPFLFTNFKSTSKMKQTNQQHQAFWDRFGHSWRFNVFFTAIAPNEANVVSHGSRALTSTIQCGIHRTCSQQAQKWSKKASLI